MPEKHIQISIANQKVRRLTSGRVAVDVFSRCRKRWPSHLVSALQDKTVLRIRIGRPTGVMIDGSLAVDIERPFGSSDKEVGKK